MCGRRPCVPSLDRSPERIGHHDRNPRVSGRRRDRGDKALAAVRHGVRDAVPDAVVIQLPMSDGGEGFVAAIAAATGDTWVPVVVPDALGRPIEAGYAWSPATNRAVIEMASAAGLEAIAPGQREVRLSSTAGVGRLVLAALDAGARHLVIGLG